MAVFKIEKNNKVIWCVKVRYDTWTSERKQKKKEGFKTRREALGWENSILNNCKNDIDITDASIKNGQVKWKNSSESDTLS